MCLNIFPWTMHLLDDTFLERNVPLLIRPCMKRPMMICPMDHLSRSHVSQYAGHWTIHVFVFDTVGQDLNYFLDPCPHCAGGDK